MPGAQSTSLFASDYSLSAPTSPASGPPSPQPFTRGSSGSLPKVADSQPESPAEDAPEPLAVVFKKQDDEVSSLPTPPASPMRRDSAQQAAHEAAHKKIMRKKSSFMKLKDEVSEQSPRRASGTSYSTYEACMEGGSVFELTDGQAVSGMRTRQRRIQSGLRKPTTILAGRTISLSTLCITNLSVTRRCSVGTCFIPPLN